MAEFRLIISDPGKKSAHKMEVSGAKANKLFGLGIGDSLDGDVIGLSDYALVITGGSDKDGVAMRRDLPGRSGKGCFFLGRWVSSEKNRDKKAQERPRSRHFCRNRSD